jgi:cytochrome b pre-mRNA-processing protein 3
MVLAWLRGGSDDSRKARDIYGAVVAAARQPRFYRDLCVPDTAEGRLEMLVLHLVPVLARLGREGGAGQERARLVTETFVTDMDDNMREIGIGDLTVPRKVKRAAALLHERHRDYGAALGQGDEAGLIAAITAAFTPLNATPAVDAASLADTLRGLQGRLDQISDEAALAGLLPLTDPNR